jgi:hypothetical protein
MRHPASGIAQALARRAAEVCRHYLSNGRRQGAYWLAGDVHNASGASLYVRLTGPDHGPGAAGHWTDAATGEHGDLLDLIGHAYGLDSLAEVLAEAADFLALPRPQPAPLPNRRTANALDDAGREAAARRLFARGRPLPGTLAQTYLAARGIVAVWPSCLRYHPRVALRSAPEARWTKAPALLAAVTDLKGDVIGVQRTWLAADGSGKADVANPRRSLGRLMGHGVRLGAPDDVLAAGEGLETVLSLVTVLPRLPTIAALSASCLGALTLPASVRRLYVARDNDAAGQRAIERLRDRVGVSTEVLELVPAGGDFNDDLQRDGVAGLTARLKSQIPPEDWARFA